MVRIVPDKGKGLKPPSEVLWVAHPHSEVRNLLEERRRRYHLEFNAERIRRPIKLVLQILELPVFWCLWECGPEGIVRTVRSVRWLRLRRAL